MMAVTRGGVPT